MRLSGGHDDTPFTCSGKGSGEFRLRRPGPGRATHLVVQPSDPDTSVSVLLSRSALGSAPAWIPATAVTAGTSTVVVAPGDVTRVRIETGRAQRWSAGVLKADDLPVLEADGASDVGGGLFRHSLGPVHTAVSCEQPLRLMFFQLCDCEADCENERHRAPTQIAAFEPTTCGLIQLPEMSGIVAVHTVSGWSVVPRDQATTGDLSALVRAEVARLLPGLVAEQLAALGVKGTPAARASAAYCSGRGPMTCRRGIGTHSRPPTTSRTSSPRPPLTTWPVLEPRAAATAGSPPKRLEKATRLLGEAGQKDQSKAVFAAIGRGREALARLDALRNGRPVPLEFLTRADLTAPPKPERTVHTAERFVWKGQGEADFSVDRPFPHRTLPAELKVGSRGSIHLVMMERTDAVVVEHDTQKYWSGATDFLTVPPEITHFKIDQGKASWLLRAVDPARYPLLEDKTRGEERQIFRHRLGGVRVTVQCLNGLTIKFHEICDCARTCGRTEHRKTTYVKTFFGEAHNHCYLPKAEGLLVIEGSGRWSLDVSPPAGSAR